MKLVEFFIDYSNSCPFGRSYGYFNIGIYTGLGRICRTTTTGSVSRIETAIQDYVDRIPLSCVENRLIR